MLKWCLTEERGEGQITLLATVPCHRSSVGTTLAYLTILSDSQFKPLKALPSRAGGVQYLHSDIPAGIVFFPNSCVHPVPTARPPGASLDSPQAFSSQPEEGFKLLGAIHFDRNAFFLHEAFNSWPRLFSPLWGRSPLQPLYHLFSYQEEMSERGHTKVTFPPPLPLSHCSIGPGKQLQPPWLFPDKQFNLL